MSIFYQIVPKINYGYSYICVDENGKHMEKPKDRLKKDVSLMFKSSVEADTYIEKHLDVNKYESEEVFLDEEYFDIET